MKAQRALLDALMGQDRNAGAGGAHWSDAQVCKSFLAAGVCPESLFTNTRHDLGGCRLLHSDALRAAYLREAPGKFEPMVERHIARLLEDLRRRTARAHERLRAAAAAAAETTAAGGGGNNSAELERLVAEITALHDEAERLGDEGRVEESRAAFERAEALRSQQTRILAGSLQQGGGTQDQALRVCETCGAYLSLLEPDKGLMDHFSGRMHQGYRKLVDAYNALQERKPSATRRYYTTADGGAFVSERQLQMQQMQQQQDPSSSVVARDSIRRRSRSRSPVAAHQRQQEVPDDTYDPEAAALEDDEAEKRKQQQQQQQIPLVQPPLLLPIPYDDGGGDDDAGDHSHRHQSSHRHHHHHHHHHSSKSGGSSSHRHHRSSRHADPLPQMPHPSLQMPAHPPQPPQDEAFGGDPHGYYYDGDHDDRFDYF